ncbi:MAG: response regulator [Spirochaetales bacterium]|nr:response regulator [Spirochaetales bacterium]
MGDDISLFNSYKDLFKAHQEKSFSDAAPIIFNTCKDVIGADSGHIALFNHEKSENTIVYLDSGNRDCFTDPALPMSLRGLRKKCTDMKMPVYENNFSKSENQKNIPASHVIPDNALFAPIILQGHVEGLLGLGNKPGGFTEEDCLKASYFADNTAVILQNSRNLERLENAYSDINNKNIWMERLNTFLLRAIEIRDKESLGNLLIDTIYDSFDCTLAGMGQVGENARSWNLSVNSNSGRIEKKIGLEKNDLLFLGKSLHEIIISGKNDYLFKDNRGSLFRFMKNQIRNREDFFIVLPFGSREKPEGILFFELNQQQFNENKIFSLKNMAEYTALLLQKITLYEDLKKSIDILMKTQEKLKRQERIKAMGVLASGITHDINNTLAPIALYTEALLSNKEELTEKSRKYLKIINGAVSDIENITSRLMAFYKNDDQTIEYKIIAVEALFENVIDLTRPKWESIPNKNGIVISIRTDIEDDPSLWGNESDIRESLINCIFNSVDAMPHGGEITLSASLFGDSSLISIKDTGKGMKKEQLDHCFEPFFSTKGKGGTGLGLTEVFGMVQRHKGDISIDSEPGLGTTISIFFPLNKTEDPLDESEQENEIEDRGDKPLFHILCVDDDLRILDGLEEMLSLEGHSVTIADSGADALEQLEDLLTKNEMPDLVITDLGMPEMDGFELARNIAHFSRDLPVVLLSAWGHEVSEKEASDNNIRKILLKPPRIKKIREVIGELFQ